MDASSTRTRFTPFVVTENSSIEELRGVLPNKNVPIYARKKNGVVTIYFDEMKKNASAEKAHLAIARLLNPGGEANKTIAFFEIAKCGKNPIHAPHLMSILDRAGIVGVTPKTERYSSSFSDFSLQHTSEEETSYQGAFGSSLSDRSSNRSYVGIADESTSNISRSREKKEKS